MELIESRIEQQSAEFQANAEHNRALAATLRERLAAVRLGGDAEARARLRADDRPILPAGARG